MKQRVPVETFELQAGGVDAIGGVLGPFLTEHTDISVAKYDPEEARSIFAATGRLRLQAKRRASAFKAVWDERSQKVVAKLVTTSDPIDIVITRTPASARTPKDRTPST